MSIKELQGLFAAIWRGKEGDAGKEGRLRVSFLRVFWRLKCFSLLIFSNFSEECGIAGYGDMVIAAVLQGDGDSRFWL